MYWKDFITNEFIEEYKDTVKIRADWDKVKYKVMLTGLQAKFSQNDFHIPKGFIREKTDDPVWGFALGLLLMYVRDGGAYWYDCYSKYMKKEDFVKFF